MTDENQQITSLTQQTAAHLISRMAKDARTAQHILGQSDNAARNAALSAAAAAIRTSEPEILSANQRDRIAGMRPIPGVLDSCHILDPCLPNKRSRGSH